MAVEVDGSPVSIERMMAVAAGVLDENDWHLAGHVEGILALRLRAMAFSALARTKNRIYWRHSEA